LGVTAVAAPAKQQRTSGRQHHAYDDLQDVPQVDVHDVTQEHRQHHAYDYPHRTCHRRTVYFTPMMTTTPMFRTCRKSTVNITVFQDLHVDVQDVP